MSVSICSNEDNWVNTKGVMRRIDPTIHDFTGEFGYCLYTSRKKLSVFVSFPIEHSQPNMQILLNVQNTDVLYDALFLPCNSIEAHDVFAIDDEYSVAFCMLTRGRCRAAFDTFAAVLDELVVVADAAVDVASVDDVESNSNCCTCKMSTYSSRPAELLGTFSLDAVCMYVVHWNCCLF